jgi:uncharacterized protein with GYD domain
MGVKVLGQYWTLGAFDGLLIFEAPDDETATALILHLGSLDNVHTTTLRAFVASEMETVWQSFQNHKTLCWWRSKHSFWIADCRVPVK